MKNYFIIFIIITAVVLLYSEDYSFECSNADLIKSPFNRIIKKKELLKMKVEKNKAYKISGYFMAYRFKNGVKSGREFNPSRGTVKFYDTHFKTGELYFYGLKDSIIKITEGKMKEKVINEGDKFIYNLETNKINVAAYFYNPFEEKTKFEYDFIKEDKSVSEAPLKWRSYELEKNKSKYYIWEVEAEKIVIETIKGKVSVKIEQPFKGI